MHRIALIAFVAAASSVSAADPQPGLDFNGDPLPKGALARLGSIRFRQINNCTCVAFSSDGKLLATGCSDGIIRLWSVANGRKILERTGLTGGVTAVRFMPGGKNIMASSFDGTIRLWDLNEDSKDSQVFQGHQGAVQAFAVSSDGKWLYSGGNDRVVRVWDIAKTQEVQQLAGHRLQLTGIELSPDDKQLLTTSTDNTMRLWDIAANKETLSFDVARTGAAPKSTYSQDGKLVFGATSFQAGLRSWDAATGKEVRFYTAATLVRAFALSSSAKFIAFAEPETYPKVGANIKIVGAASGEELRSIPIAAAQVNALTYSPDGKLLAAACSDSLVRVFDPATGKPLDGAVGHLGSITAMEFTPDGKHLLSTGTDRGLRVWAADTGKPLADYDDIAGAPSDLVVGEGKVICASGGKSVASAELAALLRGDARPFKQLELAAVTGIPAPVGAISNALSGDGKLCAVAIANGQIRLLNVASGEEVGRVALESANPGVKVSAGAVALDANGRLLVVRCHDNTLRFCDVATRKETRQIPNIPAQGPMCFSADGFSLLTADAKLRLWERASGQERWRFDVTKIGGATALAFSPDRRLVAIGLADGTISIRTLISGKELTSVTAGQGAVRALRFSPDGQRLASGGADSTIVIWDVAEQFKAAARSQANLGDTELRALWHDLAASDAGKAYLGMDQLAAGGTAAVDYIKANFKPPAPTDDKAIAKLIADLDADDFNTREQATVALEEVGEPAKAPLEKALAGTPSSELRTRALQILEHLKAGTAAANLLRGLRSIEVLEMIGSPEAIAALESFAKDEKAPGIGPEAKAALARLRKTASEGR